MGDRPTARVTIRYADGAPLKIHVNSPVSEVQKRVALAMSSGSGILKLADMDTGAAHQIDVADVETWTVR